MVTEELNSSRKKVLLVSACSPFPWDMGIKARIYNLIKALGARTDLAFFCAAQDKSEIESARKLNKYCKDVQAILAPNRKSIWHRMYYYARYVFQSVIWAVPRDYYYANLPPFKKQLELYISGHSFDVIIFEYWYWTEVLKKAKTSYTIIDTNDVQFERFQRIGNLNARRSFFLRWWERCQLMRYKEEEIKAFKKCDDIIAVTETDKQTIKKLLNTDQDFLVVSTGVDTEYFQPLLDRAEEGTIVFFGEMSGKANVEAALYFYSEVLPKIREKIQDVKFLIVGANPSKEIIELQRDAQVEVTGFVEDLRPHLARGEVCVCPFKYSYGQRGRLYEVMAMEIPVVVTSPTIEGMGLKQGEGILIKDTAREMAEAVIHILENKAFSRELGQKGRRFVVENKSVHRTFEKFAEHVVNVE
ncbi:MAG: glycosyltransferase [Candidatus Omnitrophica bacterium]|nr:glycosyltransferase [Candidatus Omnitrophota bacterium]